MQYFVRHLTRFVYTSPVSESVMELRMQPLDRDAQECLRFNVTTSQRARVFAYRDHYGNAVHYFDIPGRHARLDVSVESIVSLARTEPLPEQLPETAWGDLEALADSAEHTEWLAPSRYAQETPALGAFAAAIQLNRGPDPMSTLRKLNADLFDAFAYQPKTTNVDSPIDVALAARAGVCQDFAHIMTALARGMGIPSRYVSGYIASRKSDHDRSADNATHAWVEAYLPGPGWVGFDPTNNILAGDRHIAVAVGRDYGDVPPTRGVFKGGAGSELSVAVAVTPTDATGVLAVRGAREMSPTVSWIVPPRQATQDPLEMHGQQ